VFEIKVRVYFCQQEKRPTRLYESRKEREKVLKNAAGTNCAEVDGDQLLSEEFKFDPGQ
jgi:hypothetical protein